MHIVIARILLRYLAGALVALGWIGGDLGRQIGGDPDLIMALGAIFAIATEAGYALAKRRGWAT